jgi:hypothetical protein
MPSIAGKKLKIIEVCRDWYTIYQSDYKVAKKPCNKVINEKVRENRVLAFITSR